MAAVVTPNFTATPNTSSPSRTVYSLYWPSSAGGSTTVAATLSTLEAGCSAGLASAGAGFSVFLGFSAGGWLCAMYENLWNTPLFEAHGGADDRRPNAAILCYPLVDYRNGGMIEHDEADLEAVLGKGGAVRMEAFQEAVNRALLGDRKLTDELVHEISPTDHIGRDTPPTFVWTTFGDGLLEPTQSIAYATKLNKEHIPCELHVFQDGTHGLSLATEATAKKPEDVDPHLAHWAELACEWLGRTFA